MSGIDNRVVSMQFDNGTFERKLADTIASLDKLTHSIEQLSAVNGMQELAADVNKVDFSPMGKGIDTIASKFNAMGAIGFSAIQKITGGVLDFVKGAGEDILGPIITGGKRRAENIEQAKFQFRGLGLDVDEEMKSALAAVKGTAFGLDEAAKAAAQFGASGISAGDDLTGALRAIAGTAAMTNTSFGEIAQIFTSSAGAGKVNNQDLLQFATRGLNASAAIAKQMNTTEAAVHELAAAGKLDFKTFAKAMDDAFGEHATAANETYTGALANMHAAMSRLGASFFAPKAEQMRDIFNALTPVIDNVSAALQPLIKTVIEFGQIATFKIVEKLGTLDLSNLTAAVQYISAGLQNLKRLFDQILPTIKWTFREIFPKATESRLITITYAFNKFIEKIKIGGDFLDKVHRILRGFFSLLSIAKNIIVDVTFFIAGLVQELVQAAGFDGGGILDFFANFGDKITNLQTKLVKEGGIHDFLVRIHDVIGPLIERLGALREKLTDLFGGAGTKDTGEQEDKFGRLGQRMEQLKDASNKLSDAWQWLMGVLDRSKDTINRVWDAISNFFKDFGQKIADAFHPGDFDSVIDVLNVGLFGGIILLIRNFFKDDKSLGLDFTGGLIDKIKFGLTQVTNGFKLMQLELKAEILLKLAEAILAITASIVILSMIDSAALMKALGAMAIGFGQIAAAFETLDKLGGTSGDAARVGIVSGAMIGMATALGIFSGAVAILAHIEPAALARGMVAIATSMAILVGATRFIGNGAVQIGIAGVAMVTLAGGLVAMSGAIKVFSMIEFKDLAKGILGITAALFAITVGMSQMPINMPVTAAGIVILSGALLGMYEAVRVFGGLDWGVMGKGLLGISGALFVITVAMDSMPLTLPITAAGMVVLAGALVIMAKGVEAMGNLDAGVIGKGIGSIAAMLLILGAAMETMQGAVGGAAAMLLVSGALVVLAQVLVTLGGMDNMQLVQGMLAIAGTLAIVAAAGLLVEPALPGLIGLAVALDLISAAAFVFGAGSLLFAQSMQIMSVAGLAGTKGFIEAIKLMAKAIPGIITGVILAFVDQIDELLKAIPLFVRLVAVVVAQLLDAIIKLAPQMGKAIVVVLQEIFKVLREYYPDLIATGLDLLLHLLQGIRDNIGEVTTLVAEIVVNFLTALKEKTPELVEALYNFLHTLIVAVIGKISEEIPSLTVDIGVAMIEGFLKGLASAAGKLYEFFRDLPSKIINIVEEFLGIKSPSTRFAEIGVDILTGLLNGLTGAIGAVMEFFIGLPVSIIGWIGDAVTVLVPAGIDFIVGLLSGILSKAIEVAAWFMDLPKTILGWLGSALTHLKDWGIDLIFGLLKGIEEKAADLMKWCKDLPGKILGWLPNPLSILSDFGKSIVDGLTGGIELHSTTDSPIADAVKKLSDRVSGTFRTQMGVSSPSKVMFKLAQFLGMGIVGGLDSMQSSVAASAKGLSDAINDEIVTDKVMKQIGDHLTGLAATMQNMDDFQPTITPVLDLSQVRAAAGGIPDLMGVPSLSPNVSFDNARVISATATMEKAATDAADQAPPGDVTFIQNNHSPEPLSTHDIYRNTKSIVATAKEELGIT